MQETFYTVALFTYPTEVIVPRITLETAGIECITKDEETIATNPMLSNAVGGIKLQVKGEDYVRAVELLKEAGVEVFHASDEESIWVGRLEKWTSTIPIIRRYSLEKRMMVFLGLFVLMVSTYLYIKSRPDYYGSLVGQVWCVRQIRVNDKANWNESSKTFGVEGGGTIVLMINCEETFMLNSDGSYDLSNVYRDTISGIWSLDGNELKLYSADTLSNLLDQVYEIELRNQYRTLTGTSTTIFLKPWGM